MSNVVEFKPVKKKKSQGTKQATTLCREGHHKWEIDQDKQFDSRSGKLVTLFICRRCGKKKTRLL